MGELFTSPTILVLGLMNGLMLNGIAFWLTRDLVFLLFMCLDMTLVSVRMKLVRRTAQSVAAGGPSDTDAYLFSTIAFATLQRTFACTAMATGHQTLQVLAMSTIMGILGPLCARLFSVPRFSCLTMVCCVAPRLAGAIGTGDPWLWALVFQLPLYLLANWRILARFLAVTIGSLQAELASQQRARHDPLTGLLNRTGLSDHFVAEGLIETSRPTPLNPSTTTVFFLDLDGFKQVNDTQGHQTGDAVLKEVAARLRASTRMFDWIARLGGEFIVVAHGLTPLESAAFARGMLARISENPFTLSDGSQVRVGVSLGYACAPEDGTGQDDLNPRRISRSMPLRLPAKASAAALSPLHHRHRSTWAGPRRCWP